MQKDIAYWVGFNKVPGLGPVKIYSIWKHFDSLKTAWNSPIHEFRALEILSEVNIARINESRVAIDPEKELISLEKRRVGILTLIDEEYPKSLREIHDPPPVLFYKGKIKPDLFDKCVGIVGTRNPSLYGINVACSLSSSLAELGVTIVSGLAAGIDKEAHSGALIPENGKTIAVLGCGVDFIYPPSNAKIYGEIAERGLILSEYPPGEKPEMWRFPARNRLISGLSKGVIIIEAGEKSGALITTDFANEQGREVFAVPGDITNPMSKGPNNLIKQGANVVTEAMDIINILNWNIVIEENKTNVMVDNQPHVEHINMTDSEKEIYLILNNVPQHLDNILNKVSLPLAELTGNLAILELKQLVKQLPGKLFVKV
jgi:DNA processing protein